jgi:serine/threonine protein kinase
MTPRARDYEPGERLPGTVYDVVRLIGRGGMGTVYDVEDTTIGKRYVLKTLHSQLGAREDLARRMQKEARTLARLNHPNIVEVITAGITGDDLRLPYYVMERLNGQSLRVVLEKKGQLELPHAVHIAVDLLDALDHAHDKGVIHRDVKPDNIFLHRTSAGVTVTKLLDFGILSFLDSTRNETAGRFLGTLRYAAPEQLSGETPTPKMDVYAAGLVLYEMIAGRGPFDDEGDPQAIGAAHLEKPPPSLSAFAPVPRELEALIMASLAKPPEARPRDAFSFAARLRELKRSLSGSRLRESTEDRATAAAVIGPESAMAAYIEVRHPVLDGPYVISPARERLRSELTSLPKTTLQGANPGTLGPPFPDPAFDAPTATTPERVDRMAPTNTFVPDTVASPRHGTEPFSLDGQESMQPWLTTNPRSPPELSLRWPDERASATSEERQVQTWSALLPRHRRTAPIVTALATMGILISVAAFLLLSSRKPAAEDARPRSAAAGPPSQGAPVISSPPLASAAAMIEPIATETPRTPLLPAGSSPAHVKPRPSATSSAARPAAPLLRADRPGPGF